MTGVENSPEGIIKSDLKVSRFNRTTYTISGNFEVTENMEINYDVISTDFIFPNNL